MRIALAVAAVIGVTSFDAVSTTGGGTCSSPLDCNAKGCYDCSCTDGQCACADGWLGDHCETPFCANRTDGCSGHGSCQQTLHNISCVCDDGFIGDHCETATCALKCKHGGSPNADCTACTGCLGAWSGKLCGTWDTTVPASKLMSKLHAFANASQKMLDDQAQFNPVCRQGHECVGWGVDGATGKPTTFPIVHLSYDPTRTDKKFNKLSEPVEVESNHVVSPVWASADGARAFPRIENYVQYVDTTYAGASPAPRGANGLYSSGFAYAFNTYFQKADDRALSVARATKSYISMSLPVDPTTHMRQYQLDRYAELFLQSLPPAYDTTENKKQFQFFIERYGTSFATSATMGGVVEQYSSWKSWLTNSQMGGFTAESLAKNAQIDLSAKTGLPGPSTAHDAGYAGNTQVGALECLGGDASVSCDTSFAKWAATIPMSPVLIDYELSPISDLITDPDVKASLEVAAKAYVQEQQAAWAALSKCPPTCGPKGAGSCATGASSCTCSNKGLAGRMCTGCAPAAVRGTFTDKNGNKHSGVVTVPCNHKDVVAWKGESPCTLGAGGAKCVGTGSVSCRRAANGDLEAHVHQPSCTVTEHGDDDQKDDDSDDGTTTHAHRLRGAPTGAWGVYSRAGYGGAPTTTAQCGRFDARSSAGAGITGASATVEAAPDKHGPCYTIPSGRRRNKIQDCQLKGKCEFV